MAVALFSKKCCLGLNLIAALLFVKMMMVSDLHVRSKFGKTMQRLILPFKAVRLQTIVHLMRKSLCSDLYSMAGKICLRNAGTT